jgi:hypothetical protein
VKLILTLTLAREIRLENWNWGLRSCRNRRAEEYTDENEAGLSDL